MKEQDRENNFEELLRKKAEEFELNPSEAVWTGVKNSLEGKHEKRRFVWLWAAAAGILLGTGATTLYFLNDSNPVIDTAITRDSQPSTNTEDQLQPGTVQINPDKKEISEKDAHYATESDKVTSDQEEAKGRETLNSVALDDGTPTPSGKLPKNKKDTDPNSGITSGNRSSMILEDNLVKYEPPSSKANMPTGQDHATDIELQPMPYSVVTGINKPNEFSGASTKPLITELQIPSAPRFSVMGEVVPLISWMNYESQTSSMQLQTDQLFVDSISKLKQSNSKPFIGYSAGISGQYMLSKKWAVTATFAFTKTGEENATLPQGLEQFFVDTLEIFSNAGPTASTSGNNATAHFNWLDGSLHAEWFFYNRNRSQVSAAGGIGVSHFMKYTLKVPGYGEESLQNNSFINNNQQPALFKSYQLTASSGINYYYQLSDHFKLLTGVQFKYYVSSITQDEIPVAVHPYWLGCRLGIVYGF